MTKGLKEYIRTVPDFPKQGIMFRDVTTLFGDAVGLKLMLDQMQTVINDLEIEAVAGIDARGFIIGGALADRLGVGFVPIRKKGKLPADTLEESYELEYGTAALELHKDALKAGARVLLVDDLIATGGTALAAAMLLKRIGAEVTACGFIVDLPSLGGAIKLQEEGHKVYTLCEFEGE